MKLGQVMVFAKDMAKMCAFYRDALGLQPVDESQPAEWVRFDAGGALFALHALPAATAKKISITDPPRRRADTAIKYTFHVADVAAMRERLLDQGGHMFDLKHFGDLTLCDGMDPEGNVFQIANG
ncbi:MAG: hypothetical protein JWO36_1803 [Myxococcales bacterium]|nr:hypothetical protein [Myxococcales bacterium]